MFKRRIQKRFAMKTFNNCYFWYMEFSRKVEGRRRSLVSESQLEIGSFRLCFFFIVVLGGGTLWHLQKFLQCIKYIPGGLLYIPHRSVGCPQDDRALVCSPSYADFRSGANTRGLDFDLMMRQVHTREA
jgi:hypothetical protein